MPTHRRVRKLQRNGVGALMKAFMMLTLLIDFTIM